MNLSRKWLSEFVSVEADDKEFAESCPAPRWS